MKQKTEPERPLGEKISNLLTVDRFGESASQNWPECGAGWLNTQSAGVSWELPLLQLGGGGGEGVVDTGVAPHFLLLPSSLRVSVSDCV